MIEFTHKQKNDIFQWDVANWSTALDYWSGCLDDLSGKRVLTAGDRRGGLALAFALLGAQVTCTDIAGVEDHARELHGRYNVSNRIDYGEVDVTVIPFDEDTFEYVSFKSLLGALGRREKQITAVRKLHRILKEDGWLLFAENLEGSILHQWLRDRFVEWSDQWRYLKDEKRDELFGIFGERFLRTHGFLGTLGRTSRQRTVLGRLDSIVCRFLPARWQYILMGRCRK